MKNTISLFLRKQIILILISLLLFPYPLFSETEEEKIDEYEYEMALRNMLLRRQEEGKEFVPNLLKEGILSAKRIESLIKELDELEKRLTKEKLEKFEAVENKRRQKYLEQYGGGSFTPTKIDWLSEQLNLYFFKTNSCTQKYSLEIFPDNVSHHILIIGKYKNKSEFKKLQNEFKKIESIKERLILGRGWDWIKTKEKWIEIKG